MSPKQLQVSVAIVLVTLLSSQPSAQQPSCAPPMVSLSPCISYIIGNTSMPSSSCCSMLATIINAQTPCLCSMLNGSVDQLGFIVNTSQAPITGLPGACSIPGPSTGQCNGVSMPSPTAVSPTPSPSTSLPNAVYPAMSTKVPTSSIAATGDESRTTTNISSATRSIKMAPALLFFICSLLLLFQLSSM